MRRGRTGRRPESGRITARRRGVATMGVVLLLSRTRPEGISTLIVLPPGTRILAHFGDDGSIRDITLQAADLITEYVLRGGNAPDAGGTGEGVEVARLELDGMGSGTVRMALIDLQEDRLEEIPAERLLPLLSGAITMAVTDAVSADSVGRGATDDAAPAAARRDTSGGNAGDRAPDAG